MSGQTDDHSLRLDQAYREVSARRAQKEHHTNGAEPHRVEDVAADAASPFDDVIRRLVQEEVASALADSDVMVELGVLTAAVEHLKQRVDAIVDELEHLDGSGPVVANTRGPRLHAFRAMSNGRARGR